MAASSRRLPSSCLDYKYTNVISTHVHNSNKFNYQISKIRFEFLNTGEDMPVGLSRATAMSGKWLTVMKTIQKPQSCTYCYT